jgi:Flp pilus assembly pilin Flp
MIFSGINNSATTMRRQSGQTMTEYILVCLLVAMVLLYPFEGRPLFMLVVDALRTMHSGYMAGISVYTYPF